MLLKLMGFICFVSAGAVVGITKSTQLKTMRDSCREICEMLIQVSIMIRHRGLDVYEIFNEILSSGGYRCLMFLNKLPDKYRPGENFHEIWRDAVSSDKTIGDEEKQQLLSFGENLGTSDIEGQLMSIESVIELIKQIEQKRNEEYYRKGRLYRSVGLLFGVIAGIMVV